MPACSDKPDHRRGAFGRPARLLVVVVAVCTAVAATAAPAATAESPDATTSTAPAAFALHAWGGPNTAAFSWDFTDPVGDPVSYRETEVNYSFYYPPKNQFATVPYPSYGGPLRYDSRTTGADTWISGWCVTLENASGSGPRTCTTEWTNTGRVGSECSMAGIAGSQPRRQDIRASGPDSVTKGSRFTTRIEPGVFPVSPVALGSPVEAVEDLEFVFPVPANAKVVSASLEGGLGEGADTAAVTVADGKVKLHLDGPIPGGTPVQVPTIVLRMEATGPAGSTIAQTFGGTTNPGIAFTMLLDQGDVIHVPVTCTAASTPLSTTLVNPPTWTPFATPDAFTTRQFADFAGRAPTTAERTAWATAMVEATTTRQDLVDRLRRGAYWEPVLAPVIRLYQAYFLRLPDTGGLDYWVARRRAGTSLNAISQAFASSAEFRTRYGNLSNVGFVLKVYENVLGRTGDAAGIAFWTAELDAGRRTRGAVMAGFSESAEYKKKTAGVVTTTTVTMGLLRRVPTPGEIALGSGQSAPNQIAYVLGRTEYADRF